ncbi:MAG: hypothetical protein GYB39_05130 [Algicola sp.]|nr:hypothetical protein [Algicola sp.]
MKYIFALLLTLTSLNLLAQSHDDFFQRKEIIFPNCEESDDKYACFEEELTEYIVNNIDQKDLTFLIMEKKKDTFSINVSLTLNKEGFLDTKKSKIGYFQGEVQRNFSSLVNAFPKVLPILDEKGRGVNAFKNTLLYFTIPNNKLISTPDYTPNEVPFAVIEEVPIYKGCNNKEFNNKDRKKCMSQQIQKHVSSNFNIKKASKGLPKGTVKIFTMFKVDKEGRVTNITVRAQTKRLKKETKRVIKSIPLMEKPGYHRGKPVIVPYALPIIFKVD